MLPVYLMKRGQRKADDLRDELHVQGIMVIVTFTDDGFKVEGALADVLLAKKHLREQGVQVLEDSSLPDGNLRK